MNQVGLVGRITRDPAIRQLSETRVQTSFVVAINRNFRNNQGTVDTDFVLCTAWGKLAERIVRYCGKGSLIGVNGRLQSRSYSKENLKVYTTEIVVEDVRFYALKNPEVKNATTPGATMVIEPNLPPAQDLGNQAVAEHFVLPEKEDELPIYK